MYFGYNNEYAQDDAHYYCVRIVVHELVIHTPDVSSIQFHSLFVLHISTGRVDPSTLYCYLFYTYIITVLETQGKYLYSAQYCYLYMPALVTNLITI